MSADNASLLRLAEATGDAVTGLLEMFCQGRLNAGQVSVVAPGTQPLDGFPTPAIVTKVSYVDGATGGNAFAMTRGAARWLAATMTGEEHVEDDSPLNDLELSAIGEAMNQMMAAAASATGAVLGHEVDISPPETVMLDEPGAAAGAFEPTAHATTLAISLGGEACRFVQLVPNAFLVRASRALEDLGAEFATNGAPAGGSEPELLAGRLADVPVRVWAELGRSRMPAGRVVGLPPGTVVELDRDVEEPIDLYVNGLPFATGRLVVSDGDWAVKIESVVAGGASGQLRNGGGS